VADKHEFFSSEESSVSVRDKDTVVRQYGKKSDFEYPLLMLSCGHLELFRVEVMKGMLGKQNYMGSKGGYNVYIDVGGVTVWVGMLENKTLKYFLTNKVFLPFEKKIMLDPDVEVKGDMMFALCELGNK